MKKAPVFDPIFVNLETTTFTEADNVHWGFSIPENTTAKVGEATNVIVTMTRNDEAKTWSQGRYVTYTVIGADGSGTAFASARTSESDPAPTFTIPISNITEKVVKIYITSTHS